MTGPRKPEDKIEDHHEGKIGLVLTVETTTIETNYAGTPVVDNTKDLDGLRAAIAEAATAGTVIWLSYLFVMFYSAIAVSNVNHRDLLLENPVKLPFLSLDLPILAFFTIVPIVIFLVHSHALVQFAMLGAKVHRFNINLTNMLVEHKAREAFRYQLPNNIFVQLLAGPNEIRNGGLGRVLHVIAWVTLAVCPILLLLLFEAQFLPYHSGTITWFHRFAILGDIALIWWLLPAILDFSRRKALTSPGHLAEITAATVLVLWAFGVATFPGEWLNKNVFVWIASPTHGRPSLHELVFRGSVDYTRGRRTSLFSDTLVLPNIDVVTIAGIKSSDLDLLPHSVSLVGRDFVEADFSGSVLTKADLTGAHLQGAALRGSTLKHATLDEGQLQGALADGAHLQGASLRRTDLRGATLDNSDLQGSLLDDAIGRGATLNGARLQGASLSRSQFQEASFRGAGLQGALLYFAHFEAARLDFAQLQGAALLNSQLQGASLEGAELNGTLLEHAYVWRASLGASFRNLMADVIWKQLYLADGLPPKVETWTHDNYVALYQDITMLPEVQRQRAIRRLEQSQLDPDTRLGDGDNIDIQTKSIPDAIVQKEQYQKALAAQLQDLACLDSGNAIYIVRGLITNGRIAATEAQASALINRIEDCLSTTLTANDRTVLQDIAPTKQP
jgi:uncharacterized protein YjbI with pentapeptide repeats